MSKSDIILLGWFSPILICVVGIPPALAILFCQKVIPILWRHYPRWWRYLPGSTASDRQLRGRGL